MSWTESGSDGWLLTGGRGAGPASRLTYDSASRRVLEVIAVMRKLSYASLAQKLVAAQMRRQNAARANQADTNRIRCHFAPMVGPPTRLVALALFSGVFQGAGYFLWVIQRALALSWPLGEWGRRSCGG